jgi:dihydrodipicolinate synthase/N-acetylneuraminate lyase
VLKIEQLKGPWAGLPVAWNEDYSFDEKTYRGDVARCCEAGVPGVYTCGTTGEFYALEFEEFQAVTDAAIGECKNAGTPVMIGCSSTHTRGAARRAKYAMEKGADAIQLTLPFWMEVPDNSVVDFFADVSAAVPEMPITIYETLRTKKAISLELHKRIKEKVPAVIGVKANDGTVGATPEGCAELSKFHRVFVQEDLLAVMGPHGAIGSASALVYQNPKLILRVFDLLYAKQWEELGVWTSKLQKLTSEGLKPCFGAGCMDSALDRVLGLSAGFLKTSLFCRKPYPSATPDMLIGFRNWVKENLPEFLEL